MNYDKSNVSREKRVTSIERYREGGKQKQYQGLYMLYTLRITKISYQKYSSSFVKSESELMMTDDE